MKTLGKRGMWLLARSFKAYCAWREEHPAVYDAAMDRISRWVPELKDYFERTAAKAKVKHKLPASLEERAVANKQKRAAQWASAKASRRGTSASPSFARKRKCRDEAPARVTKQVPWPRVPKQLHNCGAKSRDGQSEGQGGETEPAAGAVMKRPATKSLMKKPASTARAAKSVA